MRRDTRPAGRAGFTLIELLIVIAILALLAALVAAGIARVKDAQQSRVTDQTLTKLQLALDGQWKAICDQCRDDRDTYSKTVKHPQFVQMVTICDGDVDRAEALWMFLNLRRSMPQDFNEASKDITLTANGQTVFLPKSSAFKQVQGKTGGNANAESAVLLYMILSQGARGTNFSLDDATQGAQTSLTLGGVTLPAFKDSYGTPIAFQRFFQNAELEAPPYVRNKLVYTDPLDPVGRLNLWKEPGKTTASPTKALAEAQIGTPLNGKNRIATVASAGGDQQFGTDDDAYGYRLTRQGAKGD